jgi:peptidoglycan/LPS O-acetylase OafA/YrhL
MHGDRDASAVPARTAYLPGLDGLRAISVVAVLLYHAGMRWLPGGFLGVEVFFVISGYLITLLLSQEFSRTHRIAVGRFWLRRARRLLAALYTLLAVVSTVVLVFYREDADKLAGQVWAALTYVTNWFLIVIDQSYFATVERPMVFQHLWSLAIEEQFYLLWPVLLLGLLRVTRNRQWLSAIVVTVGAAASLVWMAVLFQPAMDPSRVYYGTDTRAAGLLLGAALALVWKPTHRWRGNSEIKTVTLDLAGMAGIGVLVACFAVIRETDTFLYRGGFAVVSLASCVAIAATVHPGTVLGVHVLGRRVMTWIGKRSYSLYLWHWPIFVYTQPEIDLPLGTYATLVLRLVLTAIAAELSYRYVEVPIRNGAFARWRRRLARRQGARRRAGPIVFASAAGLLLLAVNTVDATGSSSLDQLTSQDDNVAAPTSTGPTPTTAPTVAAVLAAPPAATVATTTTTPAPPTVTVLADSVLLGAEDALVEELTAAGHKVDFRGRPALMLHQANNDLEAANRPVGKTVIVGLGHNTLWERDRVGFDDWAEKFDSEADELLATLRRLGAERIIWITLREPSEDVIPPEGRRQFQQFVWYFPYVNERLDALVARHPEVVLADWAAVSNEAELTYDAMHLTSRGIRLMIDTIRAAGSI